MSLDTRKVLFFTKGMQPTATELAQIARIRGNVLIRNGSADTLYGEKLESHDAIAGTPPAAYAEEEGAVDVTPSVTARPEALLVLPATANMAGGTLQLRVASAQFNDETGAITLQDVTATATYASSTPAAATVNSSGVVSHVAGGTTEITATLTTPAVKAEHDFGGSFDTVVEATTAGKAGNSIGVELRGDSAEGAGVVINVTGTEVIIHYEAGVSTVTNVETAITALAAAADIIGVKTGGTGATVLTASAAVPRVVLDGGSDATTNTAVCAVTTT